MRDNIVSEEAPIRAGRSGGTTDQRRRSVRLQGQRIAVSLALANPPPLMYAGKSKGIHRRAAGRVPEGERR